MSVDTTKVWKCDYCDKTETTVGPQSSPPAWKIGVIIAATYVTETFPWRSRVDFCGTCDQALFPEKVTGGAKPVEGAMQKNKPFWKRFFNRPPSER